MTRAERIEAAAMEVVAEAERHRDGLAEQIRRGDFPPGYSVSLSGAVAALRAALAPESGGPNGPWYACPKCAERFQIRLPEGMVLVSAPSSPSSAQGEGPVYCARCHLTEPLHHSPNIYTGRKDTMGHPYPPACEAFVGPTDPSLAGGGA